MSNSRPLATAFLEQGIAGIEKDAPRSGRPRFIAASKIDEIVSLTTLQTPADATHWNTRTLAQVAAVSPSTVGRIWRAHGFAKRLGVSETIVRRMLNPKHHTKPDKIQAPLAVLGKRIVVTFEDAA